MSELVIRDRGEPVASPAKSVMPPKAEVVDTRQTGSGLLPPSSRRFGGQVVASLAMTQLAHEVGQPSTRGKSLRIFRSRVKPANQKYSAFVLTQISRITSPVSRRMRGARERHERAVRCGGR